MEQPVSWEGWEDRKPWSPVSEGPCGQTGEGSEQSADSLERLSALQGRSQARIVAVLLLALRREALRLRSGRRLTWL